MDAGYRNSAASLRFSMAMALCAQKILMFNETVMHMHDFNSGIGIDSGMILVPFLSGIEMYMYNFISSEGPFPTKFSEGLFRSTSPM